MSDVQIQIFDDRESWLAARKETVGSSEMPAIMGRSPFASALDVWREKTNPDAVGILPSIRMRAGLALEQLTTDLLAEESGLWHCQRAEALVIHRRGFRHSTPDGAFHEHENADVNKRGKRGPLELKAVGAFAPQSWRVRIPDHVVIQTAQHMDLWPGGATHGIAAGLMLGSELLWRVFEHDAELEKTLDSIAEQFWTEHVKRDIPPDPTSGDLDTVRELFPTPVKKCIRIGDDEDTVGTILKYQGEIDWRAAAIDEYKARLMLRMEDADEAITAKGRRVTWRKTKAGSRVLRIQKKRVEE